MKIQDAMLKQILQEIEQTELEESGKVLVDVEKAKKVAKMLTELSVSGEDADTLYNQYIANIKNICKD